MGLAHSPRIVTNGLRLCTDINNAKSYTSGTTITDMITKRSGTDSIPNASVSWMNAGVNAATFIVVIQRLANNSNYAHNPFYKYANTTDNTFNMYMFGNFAGANSADEGRIRWYSNRGGTWNSISGDYVTAINETVIVQLQYNSSTGGQLWINGTATGARTGSGTLGTATNTSNLTIYAPPTSSPISKVYYTGIYDRELSSSEILQNYAALRGRYGV